MGQPLFLKEVALDSLLSVNLFIDALSPTGQVDFDSDEQVRSVIHLVFDKFDELGSVRGVFY